MCRQGAIALLLVLGAGACGQKGALYLPERGAEVITRPTQTPSGEPSEKPQTPEPAEPR
jgi:predicted small lipoprotein YifL